MTRRALIGLGAGAGAAGLGSVAVYRTAPRFWRQYVREYNRPVRPAPHRPSVTHWPDSGLFAAWLGHATLLIKVDGATILTDPVLFDRVGLSLGAVTLGPKRVIAPAVKIRDLPPIDLLLLSHAHMDHFDIPSLRGLESKRTSVVTAHSTSDLLRVGRYGGVQELSWGQRARVGPFSIQAFEVNHWGARMRTDTYRGYNGYVIEAGRHRILFAGDTAIADFRPLKSSRKFDLAIMPIGAYDPWIRYHCTPEQAWEMGNQAGAERFIPVHHQTFDLSREPWLEPIERLHAAAGNQQDRIAIARIGQEFRA
jgi:L-ascorbate metabolism protein UlaG (beta-lactamase superfamily)